MPTTSPVLGYPLPTSTDLPDGPAAYAALAQAIETDVVMTFATTSARDTAITSPVAGMFVFISGTGIFYSYTGSAWQSLKMGFADTGWISTGITVGAGSSSITGSVYRVIDNLVTIDIAATTNAALTASASGNLADTIVANLPTAATPVRNTFGLFTTNGISGACYVGSSGPVYLIDSYPSQTIASGTIIRIHMSYTTD